MVRRAVRAGRSSVRAVMGPPGFLFILNEKRGQLPPLRVFAERLLELELAAAVLAPAGFLGFGAEGLLLAIADGGEAGLVDAQGLQVGQGGGGTAVAEGQVVLVGAALIAVAFDLELGGGEGLHEVGDALEEGPVGFLDVGLVVVEVDGLEGSLGGLLVGGGLLGLGGSGGLAGGFVGGGLAGGLVGSGLVGGSLVGGGLVGGILVR